MGMDKSIRSGSHFLREIDRGKTTKIVGFIWSESIPFY